MKKLGCLFVILGLILWGVASFFMIGMLKDLEGQLLTSLPLKTNTRGLGEFVWAPKDPHYEVRLTFLRKSHEDHPHFRFPISYRIVDEKGTTMFSEEAVADPDGSRPWGMTSVTRGSTPISAEAEFYFGHFGMDAPGNIRLEAELKPDPQTREEPIEPQLRVYYQLDKGRTRIAWLILPLGALVLGVVGLALFIAGFFTKKRPVTVPHK